MIAGTPSSLSALQAFSTKIGTAAHNIANMNTDGFKKSRVLLSEQVPQGVGATVEQVDLSAPGAGGAVEQDLALTSPADVDLSEEIPEMMTSVHGYKANLKTLQAADQMLATLLDIKA